MPKKNGAKSEAKGTQYVILREVDYRPDDPHGWQPVRQTDGPEGGENPIRLVRATSPDRAIVEVTGRGLDALQGNWKAIPYRSWKGGKRILPPKQVANTEPLFDVAEE